MAFLKDDEYILLMDAPLCTGRMLSIDELKQLKGAGIQTTLWMGPIEDDYLSSPATYFDNYLERMHQAGLKCLVPIWVEQSHKRPIDWYAYTKNGPRLGVYSPWNVSAQVSILTDLKKLCHKYASPTCQFISGQCQGGERLLMNIPAYFDKWAVWDWHLCGNSGLPDHTTPEGDAWLKTSYLEMMVDQQVILVRQHNEIWFQLGFYKTTQSSLAGHGCNYAPDLINVYHEFGPQAINHISFNYFPYGQTHWDRMAREIKTLGFNEFAGAEYCEGLKAGNGRLAVEHGLRGLLVGPTHGYTKHKSLEPWMVDEISKANRLFEERNK